MRTDPADATGRSVEIHKVIIDGDVTGISEAIKSEMIEPFYVKGFHGYCDEEGKVSGKPLNIAATSIARQYGFPTDDVLCGDVIFLGEDREGHEADLPQAIMTEILKWRDANQGR